MNDNPEGTRTVVEDEDGTDIVRTVLKKKTFIKTVSAVDESLVEVPESAIRRGTRGGDSDRPRHLQPVQVRGETRSQRGTQSTSDRPRSTRVSWVPDLRSSTGETPISSYLLLEKDDLSSTT